MFRFVESLKKIEVENSYLELYDNVTHWYVFLGDNFVMVAIERKLKRSLSDRQNFSASNDVTVFNDTMRIHVRHKSRPDSRAAFDRPAEPPPPPPPPPLNTIAVAVDDKIQSDIAITELFLNNNKTGDSSDGNDENKTVVQVSPSGDNEGQHVLGYPVAQEQKTSILINSNPGLKTSVIIGEGGAAYAASSDNKVTISIGPSKSNSVGRSRGGVGNYRSNVTVVNRAGSRMSEFIKMNYDPVQAARLDVTPHVCGRQSSTPLVSPYRVSEIEKHHVPMLSDTESSSESCYASAKEDASYSSSASSFSSSSSSSLATATMNCGTGIPALHHHHQLQQQHYDTEPIYEEISESPTPPPLPSCPPPERTDLESVTIPSRSIFEGATKYDIINYLVDAKRRCGALNDNCHPKFMVVADDLQAASESDANGSACNDSGGEEYGSGTSMHTAAMQLAAIEVSKKVTVDIERNDSGVGSETSQSSRSKWQQQHETQHSCEDCDQPVEVQTTDR